MCMHCSGLNLKGWMWQYSRVKGSVLLALRGNSIVGVIFRVWEAFTLYEVGMSGGVVLVNGGMVFGFSWVGWLCMIVSTIEFCFQSLVRGGGGGV